MLARYYVGVGARNEPGSQKVAPSLMAPHAPPAMNPAGSVTTIDKWPLNLPVRWLDLALISGGWGSSFLFVKLISPWVPPFAFAAERGFFAMTALLVWLVVRRPPVLADGGTPRGRGWTNLGHMLVLGTTNGWLPNVLTVVAVRHADSAVVAMTVATVPLMVVVLAHFLFAEEKFRTGQLAGILIGLLGTFLIIGPVAVAAGQGTLISVGAMFLTAFSFACGTVYGRRVARIDSAVLACGQQACGALVATAISLLTEPLTIGSQPASIWLLLVVLGVFCSAMPTVLYLRLLAQTASVSAALVAYLQPVWAMLLGWAVLSEKIGIAAVLGTGLVFVSIFVTNRRQVR
jgi:drug/metabolite transporter (DMT)-like permease